MVRHLNHNGSTYIAECPLSKENCTNVCTMIVNDDCIIKATLQAVKKAAEAILKKEERI